MGMGIQRAALGLCFVILTLFGCSSASFDFAPEGLPLGAEAGGSDGADGSADGLPSEDASPEAAPADSDAAFVEATPDAAPDAAPDSGVDTSAMDAANPPATVTCGGSKCSLLDGKDSVCCVDTMSCISLDDAAAAGACKSIRRCEKRADCMGGGRCCDLAPPSNGTACLSSCEGRREYL